MPCSAAPIGRAHAQTYNASYVWLPLLPRASGGGFEIVNVPSWRVRDFIGSKGAPVADAPSSSEVHWGAGSPNSTSSNEPASRPRPAAGAPRPAPEVRWSPGPAVAAGRIRAAGAGEEDVGGMPAMRGPYRDPNRYTDGARP